MVAPRHAYVHVPFCARRCTYCDFAIAVRRSVPVDEYLIALGRELEIRRPLEGARLDTLYFGGGTPSRLGGEGIVRAVDLVRRYATLDPGAEITIEANPEDVSHDAVAAWSAAGVNRVSLGVQSFDDAALRWMHRVHDSERARRAAEAIREAGIANLSLDLIFALPSSVPRSWPGDVEQTLALQPSHLSLYGLTIEERTALGRALGRGELEPATEESYEQDFLLAHRAMSAAGLEHYEVSSFALPGSRSRHNSAYWRRVPYAGLGPGAHGLEIVPGPHAGTVRRRRWNEPAYVAWARALERGEDPVKGSETLSEENETAESVYLGLRTREGLTLQPNEMSMADLWSREGWATIAREGPASSAVLRLTPIGWLRLDSLAASLTTIRSR